MFGPRRPARPHRHVLTCKAFCLLVVLGETCPIVLSKRQKKRNNIAARRLNLRGIWASSNNGDYVMANQGGSHEQHVKAGQQSHKNSGSKQASSSKTSEASSSAKSASSGKQGGSHEQQVKAGQQSHKNSH